MVLKSRFILMGLGLLLFASLAGAAEAPAPGEVVLPLKDYLALVEAGERARRRRRSGWPPRRRPWPR